MNKEQILENNELIAKFMGITIKEMGVYKISELKYNTSWNWLMPVIEKIENIAHDKSDKINYNLFSIRPRILIENGFVRIISSINNDRFVRNYTYKEYLGFGGSVRFNNNFTTDSKIECVYLAVIEFIKWYNKKQK